jgi:hypothetical protein
METLTASQAETAVLPHAMAAYVAWLAPQMEALRTALPATFRTARGRAAALGGHLRIPEALAHLWLGLDCGLSFATEVGALDSAGATDLRTRCWSALVEGAVLQGRLVEEEKPVRRFLEVLATLLAQQRVLVLPATDPADEVAPERTFIGWHDDEALYLLPDAAFQAVARFLRDSGDSFPIRETRLRRDLVGEGLAEARAGRTTCLVRVGGRPRRVLLLRRGPVESYLGEVLPLSASFVTACNRSDETVEP